MNVTELPAIQAPIKEKYRSDPKAALVTFHAEGNLSSGVGCAVLIGGQKVEAGLHPTLGGAGGTVCPADIFLASIVACFGITLRAVAAHMGIAIRQGAVRAEGDLDLRGTLGVAENAPVGFNCIRVAAELETGASAEQLRTLAAMAEKYAVVIQTQAAPLQVSVSAR
jgi:uncharacterized OsmC-like protein